MTRKRRRDAPEVEDRTSKEGTFQKLEESVDSADDLDTRKGCLGQGGREMPMLTKQTSGALVRRMDKEARWDSSLSRGGGEWGGAAFQESHGRGKDSAETLSSSCRGD